MDIFIDAVLQAPELDGRCERAEKQCPKLLKHQGAEGLLHEGKREKPGQPTFIQKPN